MAPISLHRPDGRLRIQEDLQGFRKETTHHPSAQRHLRPGHHGHRHPRERADRPDQPYFMERAIFYSARTISQKGQSGKWDYDFKPVFFLGLLNFDIQHLEPEKADYQRFIHKFSLREDETHEQMSQALRFAFMEVDRFDKAKDECESFEERFLWMMKNLPTFVEKPELWDDPYFNEFMEQAEFASMSFEEQEAYIASMKQKWDYDNSIEFAEQKGMEKGLEQGKEQRAKEIAQRMLEGKMPLEQIVEFTGLTEKQVRAL